MFTNSLLPYIFIIQIDVFIIFIYLCCWLTWTNTVLKFDKVVVQRKFVNKYFIINCNSALKNNLYTIKNAVE